MPRNYKWWLQLLIYHHFQEELTLIGSKICFIVSTLTTSIFHYVLHVKRFTLIELVYLCILVSVMPLKLKLFSLKLQRILYLDWNVESHFFLWYWKECQIPYVWFLITIDLSPKLVKILPQHKCNDRHCKMETMFLIGT